ncbi:MAG: hypothetical protein GXO82_07780 [Chlorobi bacterium]|nr:hypothetical protein [Chlorobiota bacterium]
MKQVTVCLLVFAFFLNMAAAQEEEKPRPIRLGPELGVNTAMNTVDYNVSGVERFLGIGSSFGVVAEFPLGKITSAVVGMHYYTLTAREENKKINVMLNGQEANQNLYNLMTTESMFQYIAFQTMFRVEMFEIGFQFGVPVQGGVAVSKGEALPNGQVPVPDQDPVRKEDINFMVEGRIGGAFPVFETSGGILVLRFSAGYPFTTMAVSSEDQLPKMEENFRLPNLQLSISWLFDL